MVGAEGDEEVVSEVLNVSSVMNLQPSPSITLQKTLPCPQQPEAVEGIDISPASWTSTWLLAAVGIFDTTTWPPEAAETTDSCMAARTMETFPVGLLQKMNHPSSGLSCCCSEAVVCAGVCVCGGRTCASSWLACDLPQQCKQPQEAKVLHCVVATKPQK